MITLRIGRDVVSAAPVANAAVPKLTLGSTGSFPGTVVSFHKEEEAADQQKGHSYRNERSEECCGDIDCRRKGKHCGELQVADIDNLEAQYTKRNQTSKEHDICVYRRSGGRLVFVASLTLVYWRHWSEPIM